MPLISPPSCTRLAPAPNYSSLPSAGEETIEFTPRGNSSLNNSITRSCSFMNVILKINAFSPSYEDIPTYGRGSTVHGEIGLKSSSLVLSVSVKLKGRLHLSISDSGSTTATVVSESLQVWSQNPIRCDLCPGVLPFAVTFPQTFTTGERVLPIPPSFYETFYQHPAVTLDCRYMLKFTIHYGGSKMTFLKPSRSYSVQLNYRPRTRPQRPIYHLERFLLTVKQAPGDWLQIESSIRVRPTASADVRAVSCRFFIPSVGAFGLSDAIPFHIQLSSNLTSLRLMIPEDLPDKKRSRQVRVLITRQIMVQVNTRKCWRTRILGEGIVRALPPPFALRPWNSGEDEEECIDWEGEVRCDHVEHGGFNVGSVIFKDYIVFVLTPPNARTCPLLMHQYSQPIKLVTDAWHDDLSHPADTV
ncbi:hypothetical protein D9757_000706 [Collybiopsis confluens]|uniref:Arrestin-like N-terminal domain-containing protein n=1 Tax=Collybiopsis confluens TaxID=2823264 RepID=A0A8H5MGM1_9AGAR|nr:hypothetical protein D9757_000706 [Collybiopsis confluens]